MNGNEQESIIIDAVQDLLEGDTHTQYYDAPGSAAAQARYYLSVLKPLFVAEREQGKWEGALEALRDVQTRPILRGKSASPFDPYEQRQWHIQEAINELTEVEVR